MAKETCLKCGTLPTKQGYYWATSTKYPNWPRVIVQVTKNGHGHTRCYVNRFTSSFGIEEFIDWHGPLVDHAPLPPKED